jgi:DNA-binding response OmpR family regulator
MSNLPPVLVVTADPALSEALGAALAAAGLGAVTAPAAAEADAAFAQTEGRCEALILDRALPDGDGEALCTAWRRQGIKLPILLLSDAHDEQDVVRGLEAGADDFICKPVRAAELIARLRAHLRTFANTEDAIFTVGPYSFRPSAKLLQRPADKRRIRLTEKEAAILKFLYRAKERHVGRLELLKEVWGYNAVISTHTLETHIYRLRQKIEPDPSNPCLLLTNAAGYALHPAA